MQLIIGDLIFFDVKTSSRRFAERWDLEQKFHVMVLGGDFLEGWAAWSPYQEVSVTRRQEYWWR